MYGIDKAKNISDLWVEVALGESKFEVETRSTGGRRLLRSTAVAMVELVSELQGAREFLLLQNAFTESGALRRDLNMRITRKMFIDEEAESAIWRCLSQNLELSESICKQNFEIESIK